MTRGIEKLIDKLNDQVTQNASLEQLLTTVQLLQNEIAGSIKEVEVLGTSRVAVFVPNVKPMVTSEQVKLDKPVEDKEKEYFELIMDESDQEGIAEEELSDEIPSYEELIQLQQAVKEQESLLERLNLSEVSPYEYFKLDTPNVPSDYDLAQKSIHDAKENTVKDLKTAISAQQRIVFVRELFRGDETMFERSIRTIEKFNTVAEAEYWIQRELKTKNGWLYNDPVVQEFERIIKRRFA